MNKDLLKFLLIAAISIPAFFVAMSNIQQKDMELQYEKDRNFLLRFRIQQMQRDSDETNWNWEVDRKALHIKDSLLKLK